MFWETIILFNTSFSTFKVLKTYILMSLLSNCDFLLLLQLDQEDLTFPQVATMDSVKVRTCPILSLIIQGFIIIRVSLWCGVMQPLAAYPDLVRDYDPISHLTICIHLLWWLNNWIQHTLILTASFGTWKVWKKVTGKERIGKKNVWTW